MVMNVITTHTATNQEAFLDVDVTKVTREMDFLVQVNPKREKSTVFFSTATRLKGVLCRTITVDSGYQG